MSNIPEEHKIADETVDGYIEQLRKIVEKSQRLESGPGGIMEMKQTIADLERYRNFVWAFYNEPMEMSWEKIRVQYAEWKRLADDLVTELGGKHEAE
jgi:hypothetical protein